MNRFTKSVLHSAALLRIAVTVAVMCLTLGAGTAWAIPSPELVIGSVSSLSQVFAVGFAVVSGFGAVLAKKLGMQPSHGKAISAFSKRTILVLGLLSMGLTAALIMQHQSHKQAQTARMQATLIRPAQFSGTVIKDKTLKETSFDRQSQSALAISTQTLSEMLELPSSQRPLLYDVRETGEYLMGSLPDASHVRYPDFLSQSSALPNQKIVLFCHNGNRSSETCAQLAARGIDCGFIAGGIEKWIVEGRPFSDKTVTKLSDLRALPDYPNKNTLLTDAEFSDLVSTQDVQIIDARYPGDFEGNHLPDAINIPIRAMPSTKLASAIGQLDKKPTIAACYDRRSCFMSQVLGLELTQAGIDFRGRYTTPWDYFVPPAPKPHVQEWLAKQNGGIWQSAINYLAGALAVISPVVGTLGAVFLLAVASRLLVLPIALKSERDQIGLRKNSNLLAEIKREMADDPIRRARAIQQFYKRHGMTPMRNLTALLFLPLMMLGLSATEQFGKTVQTSVLWAASMGDPDPVFVLPAIFAVLGGVYLHWAIAKTPRQALLWWGLGTPVLFALTFGLSFVGTFYLCSALALLLMQRAYVVGLFSKACAALRETYQVWKVRRIHDGITPLRFAHMLGESGNKSLRLSILKNAGFPVPNGVVVTSQGIKRFRAMSVPEQTSFTNKIARLAACQTCAVRSSAAAEDGADQSFAGIFESVLHVRPDTLHAAICKVIASFNSDRVSSYEGTDQTVHEGNILVQEMIDAEYAGVVFTQDPFAPGLMMIEAAKGTGDDLVSGRVTPQTFRIGRYSGQQIQAGHPHLDLDVLAKMCLKIETLFDAPQDIEWAYKNGQFYILQSRDITTLGAGSVATHRVYSEWQRVFDAFGHEESDEIILEQDEMSEVLPTPTPISFSLMSRMWAPGGSLDRACRELGVPYNVPEGKSGHLFCLFGKTYVDRRMKNDMALEVTKSKAKALTKIAQAAAPRFQSVTLPELREFLAPWKATDFDQLPFHVLQKCLSQFTDKLVNDVYVEAEKVNILAGFTMVQAQEFAAQSAADQDRLRRADLIHSPMGLLRECASLPQSEQHAAAMAAMGHRAIFDYELSSPRYNEAETLLWPLLKSAALVSPSSPPPQEGSDPISLALALQDLKEHAKHEALWLVALMRQTLEAMAVQSDLGDLVYYLKLSEIEGMTLDGLKGFRGIAEARMEQSKTLLKAAPKAVSLTLHDCERASAPGLATAPPDDGALRGNCVSGFSAVSGKIFVVDDAAPTPEQAFDGFEQGNIVVCHMVNPEWLPYLQKSKAILSGVGGWLSHMSIVAREHDWLMLVACKGLETLKTGDAVALTPQGEITVSTTAKSALGLAS